MKYSVVLAITFLISSHSTFATTNQVPIAGQQVEWRDMYDFDEAVALLRANEQKPLTTAHSEAVNIDGVIWQRLYGERNYFLAPIVENPELYLTRTGDSEYQSDQDSEGRFLFAEIDLNNEVINYLRDISIFVPEYADPKLTIFVPRCDYEYLLQREDRVSLIDYGVDQPGERQVQEWNCSERETEIWYEGWETPSFPYYTADLDPYCGYVYWDVVSCLSHTGSHSVWSAGWPDADCTYSDSYCNMNSVIALLDCIDTYGYRIFQFSYSIWYDLHIYGFGGFGFSTNGFDWTIAPQYFAGNSGENWENYVSNYHFFSSFCWYFFQHTSIQCEGMYLDDMRLSASGTNLTLEANPAQTFVDIEGTVVTWDVRVLNIGYDDAGQSTLAYYLSEDTIFNSSDVLIFEESVDPIPAGGFSDHTYSVNVACEPSGSYWAGVIVDSNEEVAETYESDNTWFSTSEQVNIPYGDAIQVNSPNGGELYCTSCPLTVTWDPAIPGGFVSIHLLNADGLLYTVTQATEDDGEYAFQPIPLVSDDSYLIEVDSNCSSEDNFDVSDAPFAIHSLEITSPVGATSWGLGTTHTIHWSDLTPNPVRIELFQGGVQHSTITSSTPSDGNWNWAIPDGLEPADDYQIEITELFNTCCVGISPEFSLHAGCDIAVLSPDGGGIWSSETTETISWSDNIPGEVSIELYRQSAYEATISEGTASDGSFDWFIPAYLTPACDYRIRVYSVEDGSCYGISSSVCITGHSFPLYSDPIPEQNYLIWSTVPNVPVGITISDPELVDAASLAMRLDWNRDLDYDDAGEEWQSLEGYSSATSIEVFEELFFPVDGIYRLEYRALDLAGNGPAFSMWNEGMGDDIAVKVDATPPTAPLLSFQGATLLSVSLAFTPTDEQFFRCYQLFYDTDSLVDESDFLWGEEQDEALGDFQTIQTTVSGLESGETYWFRLRAVDRAGNLGEWSNIVNGSTGGCDPLMPVTDLTAHVFMGSLMLTWTSPAADINGLSPVTIEGYDIHASADPWFTPTDVTHLTTVTWPVHLVTINTEENPQEFYRVIAIGCGPDPLIGEMMPVPHGSFTMGPDAWGNGSEHPVTLTRDFLIGATEVTNGQYLEALQWAFDQGLVTLNLNHVEAYGVDLIDMYDEDCEIDFDDGTFYLDTLVHSNDFGWGEGGPGVAYPEGYNPVLHPVKEVTWYGAATYCDWLSLQEGLTPFYDGNWSVSPGHNPYDAEGYRLLTEAEWEYAARFDDGRLYPWGDQTPIDCVELNTRLCIGWTTPVGNFPSGNSELGMVDMSGNVAEYVNDNWGDEYELEQVVDPIGSELDYWGRVLRGGDFRTRYIEYNQAVAREGGSVSFGEAWIGFRVCRTANP
jgi:formylglycine-generating enzyme required for sulfatase activity